MTTPTPRTDATCKAIAAMLEPLRGGTRVTDAEMKSVQGVIDALAKCAIDLERDLAAAQEELAALKAELVSVKAGYMKLAKHAERISVCAENLEYEGGYVVSGVSELNEAVDAYRAAFKETP